MPEELRCSNCQETKPVSEFPRDKFSKIGYYAYCKICKNLKAKSGNKDIAKSRARGRKYYHSHRDEILEAAHTPEAKAWRKEYHRELYTGNENYRASVRARSKASYDSLSPEEVRERSRQLRAKDPARTKERALANHLKKNYDLTLDQYNEMLTRQNGLCAICQGPPSKKKRLAVDHCHKTGKVRELLCDSCNAGMGSLRDDPALLAKALEYLQKHAQ